MFGDLLGGLIDKEQITHDTIQETLEKISIELQCSYKDFFVMIKPTDETYTMKFYVYKMENNVPKIVREISLKEVLGIE